MQIASNANTNTALMLGMNLKLRLLLIRLRLPLIGVDLFRLDLAWCFLLEKSFWFY